MSEFLAGFAEVDYTPAPGLSVMGQHHLRIAERTRDPLLANAVALRRGDETVVIVSNDICVIPSEWAASIQQLFAERTGLPAERLLVHATHSHVAPTTVPNFWGEIDEGFVVSFKESVVKAAEDAIANLEPVCAFSGISQLDSLNWNRRSMYADGSSVMHGSADKDGWLGTEGTRDPNLGVIFFRNREGKITGIIANYGTHPNCVENGCFYSADVPGEVRRLLKAMLGSDTGVVYLTGAAGNTTPVMREPGRTEQPWMGEEGLARAGLLLAGGISKTIATAIQPMEDPRLDFQHASLQIPIRPYPERGSRNYPAWGGESVAFYAQCEEDWARKIREESPVEVRVNAVRIGDTVICTNPGEIFSEFALEIRDASDARVTLISQLTDGFCGYLPTPTAFERGGYETWPCITSKLATDAGVRIVEATRQLLAKGR